MTVIDRLYKYLELKSITPYSFERYCGLANGYLKKQFKGRGSIGSEIVEKILAAYPDLSLIWLITGKGEILTFNQPPLVSENQELQDGEKAYPSLEQMIQLLQEKIAVLEASNADKEKIIRLLESQIAEKS